MYTHAHLRYAEALAHYGDSRGFFQALCRANPIGIRELVPAATLRQSNCYYSSSDAAFADRYQASAEYDRVAKNEIPLDGGWRVYSSGAGIWSRILFHCFLGVRQLSSTLILDPVIPRTLDGLRVELEIAGRPVEICYRVREKGCGPHAVEINGRRLFFKREANPYRAGSAAIPMENVLERFEGSDGDSGEVIVTLRKNGRHIKLGVRDNGIGLPPALDWRQAGSLGLRLIQMLAKQIHATVEVKRDAGTEFSIEFEGPEV